MKCRPPTSRAVRASLILCLLAYLSTNCGDTTTHVGDSPGDPRQPGGTPPPSAPAPQATPASVYIPPDATGQGPAAYGSNPLVILINVTVIWINNDTNIHTVTAEDGSFDSGPIHPGQSFSHKFGRSGRFSYFCSIHGRESMSGAVEVGAEEASAVPSPTPPPEPESEFGPEPGPNLSPLPPQAPEPSAQPLPSQSPRPSQIPRPSMSPSETEGGAITQPA